MDAQAASSGLDGRSVTLAAYLQRSGLYVFLISLTCVYYVSNGPAMLSHYDLGWHLAAGDLIRKQGTIPLYDPWSFTAGDKQWFNLSWLWDVIASIVFQYTRFSGLVLFVVACGALITGYLASVCLRQGASVTAVCVSVFATCLLYPAFEATPNIYLGAAPNMATMLFAVIFYGECLRRTRWFLLPAVMALWVNLHGGFLIGFLIIGAFGGTALLKRDWAGARIYALAGIACLVATFINPLGWRVYEGSAATIGHFVQAHIGEWKSWYHNISMPESIPGIIYVLVFVVLELRFRNRPCPIEARLLSWLFLFLGIYQFRYMSFFFLFAAVPLAHHLDRLLPERLNQVEIQKALLAAGIAGLCTLPLAFMMARPEMRLPSMLSEQDARHLQTHLPRARMLNHWNAGGLLIFYTRGAVPLFVDGRAATAYPDDVLRDYFKLIQDEIDEAAWDGLIEKYRLDTVLWVKAHDQLRRFLVGKRGWKEEYAGAYDTIYVKPRS